MQTATAVPGAPPSRFRRALPWAVIGLWVVVIAVAATFAGKLGGVQTDRAVDYLPASADSTRVAVLQDRLPGGESTDLVLVYHRDGGLTAADRYIAARQSGAVARGFDLTGGTPHGVTSRDGTTLMYPVSSTAPGRDDTARKAFVTDVRALVTGGHGLRAEVGGPGALSVDSGAVYGSLGGPLLYTTVAVVALLLILIYRSPLLWLVPLVAAGAADVVAMALTYALHEAFGTTVSGQSSGVMTILVFGVGTDYALLLVARHREELRHTARPYDAVRTALRRSGPAVLASAGTVTAGMLCLLAADLNSSRGMGPAAAVGVLSALAAMTTLLPAVLAVCGRRIFWPRVPGHGTGSAAPTGLPGLWARLGGSTAKRPVAVLVCGGVLLGALALGMLHLPGGLKQEDSFTTTPQSVTAMKTLAAAFPERGSRPITVVAPTARATAAAATARTVPGVADVTRVRAGDGWTELSVTAAAAPESAAETATIGTLRTRLPGSYVGGPSAQQLDLAATDRRDREIVVPLVLAVVLMILVALLRSLVAPLILVAAVVAVWGAALGVGGLVFGPLLGAHGTDPGLPLLSFAFLVALGVDYGIFLMHRMREEALGGAEPRTAVLGALRTTGGVIASAGIVLAATFSVLVNIPLVQLAELGLVIAVGVLLDTFVVRTYLVTSASLLLGRRLWWPGRLGRAPAAEREPDRPAASATAR